MFGGRQAQYTPFGYEQLVVGVAAGGLAAIPSNGRARKALIAVETNGLRWRDDGISPTAAVGMSIAAGGSIEYEGPLEKLRFIRSGAADAVVNVSYYD